MSVSVSVSSKSCKYVQEMWKGGKGYSSLVGKKHSKRKDAGMGTCHIHAADSAFDADRGCLFSCCAKKEMTQPPHGDKIRKCEGLVLDKIR